MSLEIEQQVQKRKAAFEHLGRIVVSQAAQARDARGDSDLDDEQPVVVGVVTTLGELRAAGLSQTPGYQPEPDSLRAEEAWKRDER